MSPSLPNVPDPSEPEPVPVPPPVPTGPALPVMTAPPPTLSGSTGAVEPSVDGTEPAVTGAQVTDPEVADPEATTDPPVPPPVISPLSLEAEASGVELLKAQIVDVAGASGGRAVRFTDVNSRVRFMAVPVAVQAPHRVTIWYAPAGTASMSIQGYNGPVTFTLPAGNGCCASVTLIVPIAPGGQLSIRLTSVAGGYPAIDGVVVEAP